jgi:hypothetical protein
MADFEARKASLEVQRLRQVVDDMAHARNRAAQVDSVSQAIHGNPYRPAHASFRRQVRQARARLRVRDCACAIARLFESARACSRVRVWRVGGCRAGWGGVRNRTHDRRAPKLPLTSPGQNEPLLRTHSRSHSLTHALTHSLILSLTHSHPPTHSLTRSLDSPTH